MLGRRWPVLLTVASLLVGLSTAAATPKYSAQYPILNPNGTRIYTAAKRLVIRDQVVEMFHHGYNSYMKYAFPQDELRPLTCSGSNVFGGYAMTLIDSLDMLALVGDDEEFFEQVRYIGSHVRFDANLKVSVFETTIRVLGGLLSAHLIAEESGPRLRARTDIDNAESKFAYSGELLRVAVAIADKLMPAFNTPTGIPFNEIHLQRGINKADGHTSCPAAAGSLLLEFGLLTQLTGNCKYVTVARRALLGVWRWRSMHQVVGTMIDIFSGTWTNTQTTIGASVDSFYEYMFKAYIVFDDDVYYNMWLDAYKGIQKYTYFGGWYLTGTVEHANGPLENFDHQINALQAFWPGLQAIAGETHNAVDSYEKLLCVVRTTVFMPEYLGLTAFFKNEPGDRRMGPGYPLRPEFIESTYFLHRTTGDDTFLAIAHDFMMQLSRARVKCGYAAILDVYTMAHEDKMDSFMLAETLKYLYFIFTPTEAEMAAEGLLLKANSESSKGFFKKQGRKLPFDLEMRSVVNTEAHPIPLSRDLVKAYWNCEAGFDKPDGLNNPAFVDFKSDLYARHREKFGRTELEKKKQCPVVDYMRDVAPFIHRMRHPEKHCTHSEFSVRPLRASKDQPKSQRPPQTTPQVSPSKATEYATYRIDFAPDPRSPLSLGDNRIIFTSTASPPIRVIPRGSVTEVEPDIGLQSLYLEAVDAVLRYAAPGAGIQGGVLAMVGLFGPTPCGRMRFDNKDSPIVPAVPRPNGPIIAWRGPIYVAKSLLCPRSDGSFVGDQLELREHIEGGIPDAIWAANFSGNGTRPNFGLLVLRGACTFVEKVHVASRLGASFVVIVNTDNDMFAMANTDNFEFTVQGRDIPAFMIRRNDGAVLKQLLTMPSSTAPTDFTLASTALIELMCTPTSGDQLKGVGVAAASSAATRRVYFAPASLHLPSLTRARSVMTVAYEYNARRFLPTVSDLQDVITWDANPGLTFLDPPDPSPTIPDFPVSQCQLCRLSVAVDGLDSPRERVNVNRGAQAVHSLLQFAGDLGRLTVQVTTAYSGDMADESANVASVHYASAQYINPWLYHKPPHEGASWSIVTVAVAVLADDVNLERFSVHMADMQRWVQEYGAAYGIVARYIGFSPLSPRKFVEIFAYESKAAMDEFTREDWMVSPLAHDGHVLQAVLQLFRQSSRSIPTEFNVNEGVIAQSF